MAGGKNGSWDQGRRHTEKDRAKTTNQVKGPYLLGSNKGEEERKTRLDYVAAKFEELFSIVL